MNRTRTDALDEMATQTRDRRAMKWAWNEELDARPPLSRGNVVGDTGFEPVTSAV